MYKLILSSAIAVSIIVSSCGEKKEEKKEDSKEESAFLNSSSKGIIPNMFADISISGMVCEMNCVSSVKTLLTEMVGVTEIEIEYNTESKLNHARIKFNTAQVSDEQMVDAIEKLNDGAFKVEKVDLKKIKEKTKRKKDDKEVTNLYHNSGSSDFALPSILDVFSTVL